MAANTDLSNVAVSSGYTQLLHIGDDNGVEATEHYVVDGNGTASALSLGTTAVGIGTDSPSNIFHIKGTGTGQRFLQMESTDYDAFIQIDADSGNTNADADVGVIFRNNGAEGFRIGIDDSDDSFHVSTGSFSTASNKKLTIDSSGNVGIGCTPSGGQLHIETSTVALKADRATTTATHDLVNLYSNVGGTDTLVAVIEANGDFQSATNSYGSTSDVKLKQDIVDANSQWEDIKSVKVKNFRMKNLVEQSGNDAPVFLGVIAQDLEESGMNGLVEVKPDIETVEVEKIDDDGDIVYKTEEKLISEAIEAVEAVEGVDAVEAVEEELWVEGDDFPEGVEIGDVKVEAVEAVEGVDAVEAVEAQDAVYETIILDEAETEWIERETGTSTKSAKYSILYMKAVKALQEAMERIEGLESKVEALENA